MAISGNGGFEHEKWSSDTIFILASIGGAVGLGNLWRFPFVAGQNGGSAFVIVYIFFVVLICLPLVLTEMAIGRRGRGSAIASIRKLNAEAGGARFWHVVGWISLLIPIVALGYYSVVAGWSIDYVFKAATNAFDGQTGEESGAAFGALAGSPVRVLTLHALFIAGAVFTVARGLGKGIEVLMRFMMPALFALLLVLLLNSLLTGDVARTVDFLFQPDFSKITGEVVLMALGQAFFSIAVGVGMLLTYGAYLPHSASLKRAAVWVISIDTLVAIVAGLVIFPIVFANGLDPADGPGLIFVTLPIAFGSMPFGYVIGLLFFVMLFFAAFSSVIGMIEPAVCYLEERKGFTRAKMSLLAGGIGWVLGLAAALSFNVLSDVRLITSVDLLADKSIFDLIDFTIASLGIPLNAALMSLFAGWVMSKNILIEEMGVDNPLLAAYIHFSLRYIAPLVIGAIFVNNLI